LFNLSSIEALLPAFRAALLLLGFGLINLNDAISFRLKQGCENPEKAQAGELFEDLSIVSSSLIVERRVKL